jgi:hypothetical protein
MAASAWSTSASTCSCDPTSPAMPALIVTCRVCLSAMTIGCWATSDRSFSARTAASSGAVSGRMSMNSSPP